MYALVNKVMSIMSFNENKDASNLVSSKLLNLPPGLKKSWICRSFQLKNQMNNTGSLFAHDTVSISSIRLGIM